jgi:hypothetical protein
MADSATGAIADSPLVHDAGLHGERWPVATSISLGLVGSVFGGFVAGSLSRNRPARHGAAAMLMAVLSRPTGMTSEVVLSNLMHVLGIPGVGHCRRTRRTAVGRLEGEGRVSRERGVTTLAADGRGSASHWSGRSRSTRWADETLRNACTNS